MRMPFKRTGQIDQGEWVEPASKITGKAVEAAVVIGDVHLTIARRRHFR